MKNAPNKETHRLIIEVNLYRVINNGCKQIINKNININAIAYLSHITSEPLRKTDNRIINKENTKKSISALKKYSNVVKTSVMKKTI